MTATEIAALPYLERCKLAASHASFSNLTDKSLDQFGPEDTIFLKSPGQYPVFYLCQFVSFKRGVVTGKALAVHNNFPLHSWEIEQGRTLSVRATSASLHGMRPNVGWAGSHWFKKQADGKYRVE